MSGDGWIRQVSPMIGEEEALAVHRVVESGWITEGPESAAFVEELKECVGSRFAVLAPNGTLALALGLLALGIGPGDEVLVPDLTFAATANAVRLAGADVKLVDVEPVRFGIDPDGVEAAIGPRTRALVTVDVNGRGADYGRLEPICRAKGLVLICDAAEGLGSRHAGRKIGSFGLASCFSFSANKTITAGQGGIVTTDSDALHGRLRELKDQGRLYGGTGGDDLHPVIGFNFKFTDLQAAVALPQLDEVEQSLRRLAARHPGALIERKSCSVCLHWRRVSAAQHDATGRDRPAVAQHHAGVPGRHEKAGRKLGRFRCYRGQPHLSNDHAAGVCGSP